jgi:DNA (cytosine-5)-methyltransferase 1
MRYLSVCSGIEAASVAWHDLGWSPVAFSEIEAFPSAVLRTHYPDVPNWGDMTKFQEWPDAAIDLVVGGTPCQSFSVAGLRKGLADPRGNLALTYLAIVNRYRPRWVVWENVPGVLSSARGRDFGAFLGGLGQLGYGWAYRVLDAQYFGVAQRRRRVFVVASAGGWQRAAAVLFERHSLSGHPAPRREAGQAAAPTLAGCANGGGANGPGRDVDSVESLIPQIANPRTARMQKGVNTTCDEGQTMIAHAFDARQSDVVQYGDLTGPLDTHKQSVGVLLGGIDYQHNGHTADEPTGPLLKGSSTGGGEPLPAVAIRTANTSANGHGVALEVAHTLDQAQGQAVAFTQNTRDEVRYINGDGQIVGALAADAGMKQTNYLALPAMAVRRLTPRECERLQGFPDDYTLIPYRGKPAADGPRYKALGNSMAVPVMRWIGQRLQAVDGMTE